MVRPGCREPRCGRDGLDSGNRTQPLVEALVEVDAANGVLVPRVRKVNLEREQIGGVEPVVLALQGGEALDEDPGPDEKNEGEGHLRGHEGRTNPARPLAAGEAARSFTQVRCQIDTRAAQRRHEAEHQCREYGHRGGEQEKSPVQPHLLCACDRIRTDREQEPDSEMSDHEPGHARDRGHQQALGEELSHQASPSGAQGRPDRDLPPPPQAAGQEQHPKSGCQAEQNQENGITNNAQH